MKEKNITLEDIEKYIPVHYKPARFENGNYACRVRSKQELIIELKKRINLVNRTGPQAPIKPTILNRRCLLFQKHYAALRLLNPEQLDRFKILLESQKFKEANAEDLSLFVQAGLVLCHTPQHNWSWEEAYYAIPDVEYITPLLDEIIMSMNETYRILFKRIVKPNHPHPEIRGILFFGTTAAATDGYSLVLLQSEFPEHFKGYVKDEQLRTVISDKPFPAIHLETSKIPKAKLLSEDIALISKACDALAPSCLPNFKEESPLVLTIGPVSVNPYRLLNILNIFKELKSVPTVHAYVSEQDPKESRLVLMSPVCTAIMAPVLPSGNGYSPNRFTVQEAIEIGELM